MKAEKNIFGWKRPAANFPHARFYSGFRPTTEPQAFRNRTVLGSCYLCIPLPPEVAISWGSAENTRAETSISVLFAHCRSMRTNSRKVKYAKRRSVVYFVADKLVLLPHFQALKGALWTTEAEWCMQVGWYIHQNTSCILPMDGHWADSGSEKSNLCLHSVKCL